MSSKLLKHIQKYNVILNDSLVHDKGVSASKVEAIKQVHQLKNVIFTMADNTDNIDALRMLANMYTNIEFQLQDLWGFHKNIDFHSFWKFPKCTCPQLDNEDALGTEYHVYNADCPIHGFLIPFKKKTIKRNVKGQFTKTKK